MTDGASRYYPRSAGATTPPIRGAMPASVRAMHVGPGTRRNFHTRSQHDRRSGALLLRAAKIERATSNSSISHFLLRSEASDLLQCIQQRHTVRIAQLVTASNPGPQT